jgi:hypothetical protein
VDFVFMLTRDDRTVSDALDVLDDVGALGLRHVGFKDVGVTPRELAALHARIKALGATSYLEVVSTTPDACLQSARVARELGVDRLLGGTQVEEVLAILRGSTVQYLPFPGTPVGHPTRLRGGADEIARDCRRAHELGAAGVDLLAYRALDAEPPALVAAARAATPGTLLVAGGVRGADQVRILAELGVDAFTIGSAVFDGSFAPHLGSLRSQLKAVLDVCS